MKREFLQDRQNEPNQGNQYKPNIKYNIGHKQKYQYILSKSTLRQMQMDNKIFRHFQKNRSFYFPYPDLNKPQRKFIGSMFDCFDNKKNLLIQSPTGTGKTLSLLVGALSWVDQYYQGTQGTFDGKMKVIYTSRAHSQLAQISKELQKTPYRPNMLLFGSRQKLCINKQIEEQMNNKQKKNYDEWNKKCNIAIKWKKQSSINAKAVSQTITATKNTIQILSKITKKKPNQIQQLEKAQQLLSDIDTTCKHYKEWDQGQQRVFFQEVGRKVLNNQTIRKLAAQRQDGSICPYFYPKRVKNFGTLYLMPYNYLLDARILSHSSQFIKNAIIIFDQGHNVPKAACSGFSINFTTKVYTSAMRNINEKFDDEDVNADEIQEQNQRKPIYKKNVNYQEAYSDDSMDDFMSHVNQQSSTKKEDKQQKTVNISKTKKWLLGFIQNSIFNFQEYFKYQRTEYVNADKSFMESIDLQQEQKQRKNPNFQVNRYICASNRNQIQDLIQKIFFSSLIDQLKGKSLKQRLKKINQQLGQGISYLSNKNRFFFKVQTLRTFYNQLHNLIYEKNYQNKFYLQVTQKRRWSKKQNRYQYVGQVNIQCLAPEFAFQKLKSLNPYSIVITSGTLKPMQVFKSEIGLQCEIQEAGHVITQKNILVRKITHNLKGDILKINSTYYSDRQGLNQSNLENIFELLTQTIKQIPNGILIVLSSFSCLRSLQTFYNSAKAKNLRDDLQKIKPYVYFQPKRNLQPIMQQFQVRSQQSLGAILFCVCRAKLSQGIDFKDRLCRSVIFLGIPYLNKSDPFVVEKGKYLKKMKSHYANQWKFIQTSRAINQALGRTVRHAKDYGAILLFDQRYQILNTDSAPVVANLSEWIKDCWNTSKSYKDLQSQLKSFYLTCKYNFPLSQQYQIKLQPGQQTLDSYYFKNKFQ